MIRRVMFALALCAVGCGGAVVSGSSDGGSDSGSDALGDGGGPDAPAADTGPPDAGKRWSPICPEDEPKPGTACSIPEQRDGRWVWCEYGKLQYDVSCDAVYQCQAGAWTMSFPPGPCQPDGPNAPSCPSTYSALQGIERGACSDDDGLRCEYPQGVCVCSTGIGGPSEIDAGAYWSCNPGPSCPMPRPRLGASCSGSSYCQYLTCEFGEACVDGFWQGELEGCA
jgi:hypothetical protein